MIITSFHFRSVLCVGALVVCLDQGQALADPAATGAATESASYDVRGIVEEVNTEGLKAVIAHEAIRGYMDAMTMEFRVKNAEELRGVERGDKIAFRLCIAANRAWIDRVQRISASVASVPSIARFATKAASELKRGDAIPDTVIRNHLGEDVRLNSLTGQAFALTFIFTRCPYPDFCPLMNNNLREVQNELLSSKPKGKWRLFSVSIDPAYDTPERLNAYARSYDPAPMRWSFATGEPAEIKKLAGSFGLTILGEGPSIQHNLRTIVVDARGKVQRIFVGNEWKAADVVAEMETAMNTEP